MAPRFFDVAVGSYGWGFLSKTGSEIWGSSQVREGRGFGSDRQAKEFGFARAGDEFAWLPGLRLRPLPQLRGAPNICEDC